MAYAARIQVPLISLFTALLAGGCAGQSGVGFPSSENDATGLAGAAIASPAWAPLTESALRNGTYRLPMYHRTVTLTDGVYQSNSDTDPLTVRLQNPIVFGDWDGDGVEDAAVLLAENAGGTGVFVSLLVLLNDLGTPRQAAYALIDDRPILRGMTAKDGTITLEAIIHGADEPMCCPEFAVTESYRLFSNALILVRFESLAADGRQRTIRIHPLSEEIRFTGTVQVSGTVAIAPFENTLVYRWLDLAGNQLAEGSFMVSADSPGAPGVFEASIPVPTASAGQSLQLKILEPSAIDGTMLAMDSIMATVGPQP